MSVTERQLTGFGEFLDWRPLAFVDKIPYMFACAICGLLPAFPRRLPFCCHVFCPSCYEKIAQEGRVCPVDLRSFSNHAVEVLDSIRGGIMDLVVRCPNASSGCTFVSKLSELQVHFLEHCCQGKVHCPRCGWAMPHAAALDHYLQDCPRKAGEEDTYRNTSKESPSNKYDGAATTGSRPLLVDSSRTPGVNCCSSRKSRSADSSPSGKAQSRLKSGADIGVRQVCSADSSPAPGVGRALALAAVKRHLQCGPADSTRPVSGSSLRSVSSSIPSQRTSSINIGSSTICGLPKAAKASKSNKNITKVPSREAHLLKKLNSVIVKAQKTQSLTGAEKCTYITCPGKPSRQTVAAASTAAPPRKESSSESTGKNAAAVAAVPAGFAFCYITGVTGTKSSLSKCEEVILSSDSSVIADCAFRVHAKFRRNSFGAVVACFSLRLCGGTRDTVAACLFARKVYVVLVHPWDQSLNISMALAPNPDAVHEEGRRVGRWDFWLPTSELKLSDIESRGFVSSGAVCVAVELE